MDQIKDCYVKLNRVSENDVYTVAKKRKRDEQETNRRIERLHIVNVKVNFSDIFPLIVLLTFKFFFSI